MNKFILTRNRSYGMEYLVSHCQIDLWKTDKEQAKVFNELDEVNRCIKFWKIKGAEVVEII